MSNTDHNIRIADAHIDDVPVRPVAPFGHRIYGIAPAATIRDPAMDQFIHDQNPAHYRKVMSETTDLTKRETVLKLLAHEQPSFRLPTKSKSAL
jgi:hypothetical protein